MLVDVVDVVDLAVGGCCEYDDGGWYEFGELGGWWDEYIPKYRVHTRIPHINGSRKFALVLSVINHIRQKT